MEEVRLVLIGKTGTGKSATGNTILGANVFKSLLSGTSVTKCCKSQSAERFGKNIVVVDTPGVFDTHEDNEDVQEEIRRCVRMTSPGPHAFIFVLSAATKYTAEEECSFEHFLKYFGKSMCKYCILLFTWKDELDKHNLTVAEYIKKSPSTLQTYVEKCGGRTIAFNNTLTGEDQTPQVEHLISEIQNNVKNNGDKCYTNDMYMDAENEINKLEAERYALETALDLENSGNALADVKEDVFEEVGEVLDVWHITVQNKDIFPRYQYHFNLVQRIVQHAQQMDIGIASDALTCSTSTIFIFGKITEYYKNIFKPLTFDKKKCNDPFEAHVINILLADTIHVEQRNLDFVQNELLNGSSWCIIISSEPVLERFQRELAANPIKNVSIVPPDKNIVWNNILSVLDIPLIEFLTDMSLKMPERIVQDTQTVLRRIESCSAFPEIYSRQKPYRISEEMKTVLKRFNKDITRYGFCHDHFRVMVSGEKHAEVAADPILQNTKVCVISENEFDGKIIPFCGQGGQAQGKKLYPLLNTEISQPQNKDKYGTLGCLANLNNEKTVALTCLHVGNKTVYIENAQNKRIPLGKCLNKPPKGNEENVIQIQNDLAIFGVNDEVDEYLCKRKLLNHAETPTNADVCSAETTSLHREIVHKFGASSQWTQGEIVFSEVMLNELAIIGVRGMNGEDFGKPGDSGSIVFREIFNVNEQRLEVIAVLSGLYEQREQKPSEEGNTGQSGPLIACYVFKDAFKHLQECDPSINSLEFFND